MRVLLGGEGTVDGDCSVRRVRGLASCHYAAPRIRRPTMGAT
jgi:hypothetical protein